MSKIKFNIGGVTVEMEKEQVSQAIEAGSEIKIENEDLVIYKKDQLESFKTNLSGEEYKKGKAAGLEMAIKDGKEKYGLEFEGKTIDNFAEALKKKVMDDAKIEPSKKIEELTKERDGLKKNYHELEDNFSQFKTQVTEKETRAKKDTTLMGFIPQTGLRVNKNITLLALKNQAGIDIDFDESGKTVIVENGQVIKDPKTFDPVDPSAFITEKLRSMELIEKPEGGKGGSDEPGGGKATGYEKFVKEMESKGVSEGSKDFQQEMNKRVSEKTLEV